ncbi:autotransporter domain-containing protein [Leptotrichia sp. oral taxon 498]|uniref:autotransporter domain-containing protein n=1 Tax=Leptotrichia sp. oral taxon 498 TaxID=712368 RepID=UPI0012FD982F|nr:autotransporter domain-containing protein [Leptotrichia sp. oral taxon 498]
MELQLYNIDKESTINADTSEWKIASSNSTLLNKGNLNLVDGYNLVGMMIDIERSNDTDKVQDKVINDGVININSQKSVGIDFGKYMNGLLKVDVELGTINVNGSNNYGFRMSNIFDGTTDYYKDEDGSSPTNGVVHMTFKGDDYYNEATVDGKGKTITVAGNNNVGVSISKGMSATGSSINNHGNNANKNGNTSAVVANGSSQKYGTTNSIANVKNLNILVTGSENVGFLRNENSSSNNINDIELNDNTVQSLTFGDNTANGGSKATKSTLVRSDKYGISINRDLSVTSGGVKNSFAQASKGGYVKLNSGKTLTSTLDEFTGMLATGKDSANNPSEVTNEGTINLSGNNVSDIGLAAVDSAIAENKGKIIISSTGSNNAGIYVGGGATPATANIGVNSEITVSGTNSTGIYNQGTVNINDNNKITGIGGTTGIYSDGGTINNSLSKVATININDTTKTASGVYIKNGAQVNLTNAAINVQSGSAGVTSEDTKGAATPSNLNLTGATLTYNGEGYAVYSNNGKINLTNATINLDGKATGFSRENASDLIFSNTKFIALSDDVTVSNLKNITPALNQNNLNNEINGALGLGLSVSGAPGINNYKLANIDGATLNINSNIDKNAVANGTGDINASTYVRNTTFQRTNIILNSGYNVSSLLNSAELANIKKGAVVGLDISSSRSAASSGETGITMQSGSYIKADRTDGGSGAVGLYVNYGQVQVDNGSTINVEKEATNVATSTSSNFNTGIFTKDAGTSIENNGSIITGDNSYGIYGVGDITTGSNSLTKVGNNGVAIFSTSSLLNLNGTVTVGQNEAVGLFTTGTNPVTINGNIQNFNIGDGSYGYVLMGSGGTTLLSNTPNVTVGNDTVFIYSADKFGTITNNTALSSTGSNNYGIYSAQDVINNANINYSSGVGNVAIYSTNGTITNNAIIDVSASDTITDPDNKKYGIGMATGYYNENTRSVTNQGTIINNGTINVTKDGSIGMYAVGSGSIAINSATGVINLDGNNTTGMYIDKNAVGINYGTIQTVANSSGTGIIGVVVANGGIIKNYGQIIISGNGNVGIYKQNANPSSVMEGETDPVTGARGTITATNGAKKTGTPNTDTSKRIKGLEIQARGLSPVVIKRNNIVVTPDTVDTVAATPQPNYVTVNSKLVNLGEIPNTARSGNGNKNLGTITSIGMYVDTSGVNYTNPIKGIQYLKGLEKIDLIFGSEAASYTNAKDIKVANNILEPYNKAILEAVNLGVDAEWILNSGNLNWIATATQKSDSTLSAVYLSKIPYTSYALDGDTDNYNFLDGLEQRYGVDWYGDRGSREKILFNKLNDLGKSETKIFTQAVDEMKGHEYSNTQHRIKETTDILSKEFEYLRKDWRNPSKQNNKIKVFGQKNEYETDTAGIIDYTSNAYGVAYVHEDETVKMGDSQGWYAGAVKNHFKFEDLGGSRENQTMIKAGLFKTMSPANDHNGSLRWTVAADMFGGIDEMKRRYWIVDDIFNARSDYYSYGTSLKTELEYDIRLSERAHLRPYGALKMEYGKFTNIKEDDGEIRLKIDSNDYFSVKPEIGAEFKYIQPLALRTQLSVGLSAAFENELGRLDDVNNKAKVRYTAADWYNLRNEKENKHGNGKFDLNIGLDNTRFGMTLNAGYDTNGKNIRSGIGFRAIY